jgi:uncharacterized protein YjbI with pentapeptide repeats
MRSRKPVIARAGRRLLIITLAATIVLILYWAITPLSSPLWTGFGPYDENVAGPRAKTLWDWMGLLIVPVVLAIGVWWLNKSDRDTEREIATERATTERMIAADRQWQVTLETYIDRMTDLLINQSLRSSQKAEVRTIARTLTLAVLRSLDPVRKGQVVRFLYESDLLNRSNPIINMEGADLEDVDLRGAKLSEVNLGHVRLNNADLADADLSQADLRSAKLVRVNLRNATLSTAILTDADLSEADLYRAGLEEADLSAANLTESCLVGAYFRRAKMKEATLCGVEAVSSSFYEADLTQANLDGANLKDAILSKANLLAASFWGTNLKSARLNEASLMAATLKSATLFMARLDGTNLSFTDVTAAQLQETESLHGATLPDGTIHDGHVILDRITSSDVLQAIRSMRWCVFSPHYLLPYVVEYKQRAYPLKELIPLAYRTENGLPQNVFDDEQARERLIALGFTVRAPDQNPTYKNLRYPLIVRMIDRVEFAVRRILRRPIVP